MGEWMVDLSGHDFDRESLEELSGPDGEWTVRREGSGFVLRAKCFAGVDDPAEVRERALAIVDILNGLAKVHYGDFKPVQVGVISGEGEENASGGKTIKLYAVEGMILLEGARARLSVGGQPAQPKRPAYLDGWLGVAQQDPRVRDALRWFAKPTSWETLYKVSELIYEDAGTAIIQNGWATPDEIRRMRDTANSREVAGEGHAKASKRIPDDPMTLEQGSALITNVLAKWLAWKLQGRS